MSRNTIGMRSARTDARRALADNQFIVIGEAPGRIEDHQGKPFVGPAGALLRSRLTNVGLNPSNAYWINAVCCWPHGTPTSDHLGACRANLQAQWEVAPPRYVLVCGHTALKALVPHTQPKYCRGVGFGLLGKVVFPTWHPAAFAPGRHSVDPSKWHADLASFAMIVRGEVEPEVHKCIYCDRDRAAYAPTCFAHVKKYQLDNQWNLPVQGELL
jgi:uracil-DNA glycosylase family 4